MKLIAQGLGASTGIVTGQVRVLSSPSELDQLVDGEVLVVQHSNPAWTVGMLRAGAIISEFGGIISHAAIVAREMGVPCVVAVEHATSLLANGMLVRVDGETGTIHEAESL
jgi:pyruvate,water dikinase